MSDHQENFEQNHQQQQQHHEGEGQQQSQDQQQHQHDEHHHHGGEHESNSNNNENNKPSAPPTSPADENGFIVVPQNSQIDQAVESVVDTLTKEFNGEHVVLNRVVDELGAAVASELEKRQNEQEHVQPEPVKQPEPTPAPAPTPSAPKQELKSVHLTKTNSCPSGSEGACSLCPYYFLVKDLILWKDPIFTGSIFGSSLVLLISLALFSLFTVVGSLLLFGLSVSGAYRFYLSLVFRIKGTYDDTFEKASKLDVTLPKDKVQELARLLEIDLNKILVNLKSILLWDNVAKSALAFFGFYIIYSIGCVFNTLTLLIIVLVDVFTLPKIYQVYQKPIDQAVEKATAVAHNVARQVSAKLPFLHKKKTQ